MGEDVWLPLTTPYCNGGLLQCVYFLCLICAFLVPCSVAAPSDIPRVHMRLGLASLLVLPCPNSERWASKMWPALASFPDTKIPIQTCLTVYQLTLICLFLHLRRPFLRLRANLSFVVQQHSNFGALFWWVWLPSTPPPRCRFVEQVNTSTVCGTPPQQQAIK